MPIADTLHARDLRGRVIAEDTLGFDRSARSFLRTCVRTGPGALVMVQGGPGSGKTEFLRRCLHIVETEPDALASEASAGFHPVPVWYNAWSYAKQGHVLAGLVAAVCRAGGNTPQLLDRAREVSTNLLRLRFDGSVPEAAGGGLSPTEVDPVERVRRGFALLVEQAKRGLAGRIVVFVADLDLLPAAARLQVLDGLRLLLGGGADAAVVVAMGRDAALAAVRTREGEAADAARALDEIVDLAIRVPRLDVRRIGLLLRRHLGAGGEALVRRAFGERSVESLLAAAGYPSLGMPRFVERLALRIVLLAEFALEARASRELGESEWSWIVLAARWPDFRGFLIRGGAERWADLREAVSALSDPAAPVAHPELWRWLEEDLHLAEYLRIYADSFERDAAAVAWVEELHQAAGL